MSFRDPLDPVWLAFGPELQAGERDARFDVSLEEMPTHKPGWRAVMRSAARGVAMLAGATMVLTVLLFLPVLFSEVASVDAVDIQGQNLTAAAFVTKLKSMLFGSFIVALSLVCFVASAAFASGQQGVRVRDIRPTTNRSRSSVRSMKQAHFEVRHV